MYDAISLAVKCALFNLKIPRVSSALLDGGNVDLVITDDPNDCDRLDVTSVPILVTVCKIGDHCVVDPSIEEEICSTGSVVIGVSGRSLTSTKTISGGSLHPDTLDTCFDLALSTSKTLNEKLMLALRQEEQQVESSKETKCSFLN